MTSPQTTAAGRRYGDKSAEERREERRARLMAAGLDMFGNDGFHRTTIEGLCTAASVSTRTFYEEFGSREALVLALHDEVNARAFTAVAQAMVPIDPTDVAARAHAAVTAYLEVMTSDRRWARIALVESVGVSAQAEDHRREAIDRFVALIEFEARRLADEGLIPRRDHRLTAVALAGALNGLVNTWTADEHFRSRVHEIADEAARLIVLALTAPAGDA